MRALRVNFELGYVEIAMLQKNHVIISSYTNTYVT